LGGKLGRIFVESILVIGIIIISGFLLGELMRRLGLPKVTGYILAGVILNPGLTGFIPRMFPEHTDPVTNIALSFITFSVGGTLIVSELRRLGKRILYITLLEGEMALVAIAGGFLILGPFLISVPGATWTGVFIPMAILMGSLGAPTDPSATLAVTHEYQAKGDVSSTILGVAAFDDALGVINYSVATAVAAALVLHEGVNIETSLLRPVMDIAGAIALGSGFGFLLNLMTKFFKKESEGVLIVLIIGLLSLCFGIATVLDLEELLATMAMGFVVTNLNPMRKRIFRVLERYTEELVFVLFFTLSGMHLDFSVLSDSYMLIICFVAFRVIGKYAGTALGAKISGAPASVRKYAAGGLIPQGGIVIGLALLIKQNEVFDSLSGVIIGVVIGATVIHEIIGPILAKWSLVRAGEIRGPLS
jgi:Kef-type K+ transport system membrane component KefB